MPRHVVQVTCQKDNSCMLQQWPQTAQLVLCRAYLQAQRELWFCCLAAAHAFSWAAPPL